jgi:hypothetical protein
MEDIYVVTNITQKGGQNIITKKSTILSEKQNRIIEVKTFLRFWTNTSISQNGKEGLR